MESTSEMETALQFYEAARDNLSLVRVYCYCGNLEKVEQDFLSLKTYLNFVDISMQEPTFDVYKMLSILKSFSFNPFHKSPEQNSIQPFKPAI